MTAAAGTANAVHPDAAEVRRAADILHQPGAVVELRALHVSTPGYRRPHTEIGYFTDHDALAREAARLSELGGQVYMALNQIDAALLARAANRVHPDIAGTTDQNVRRRQWMLVDIDPNRPSGISASDEEHAVALDCAGQARAWLNAAGWAAPILADSGNGAHLLYHIDLPADDGGLVQRCLRALAFQLDDDRMTVDQSCANPAHLTKAYGVVAAKGDSVPDRPHRVSRLLSVPSEIRIVPRELLEELARRVPDEEKGHQRGAPSGGRFDVDAWLHEHQVDIARHGPWGSGSYRWILQTCLWNPEHTDLAAFVVQHASGAVAAGCHHNGCHGKGWHDLRDVAEPGWRERRNGHGAGDEIHSSAYREGVADESIFRFRTGREEAASHAADVDWVAEPWLARGAITELVGPIKRAGKTTFALAMSAAITRGTPFLGGQTQRGTIVYLTEQGFPSFRAALGRAQLLDCDDFVVAHWHETLGHPWPEVAAAAIREAARRGADTLIVDTLSQFAGLRGDAENAAGEALAAIRPLQEAAAVHNLAVLVVRHERKSAGEVGDSGRGSSAFGGAVDTIVSLRRGEGSTNPKIRILNAVSRFDGTPDTLAIELADDGTYMALGDPSALARAAARTALLDVVPWGADKALTAEVLIERAGVKKTIGYQALKALVDEGVVQTVGQGKKGDPRRYYQPRDPEDATEMHSSATPSLRADELMNDPLREEEESSPARCEACNRPLEPADARWCRQCRQELWPL